MADGTAPGGMSNVAEASIPRPGLMSSIQPSSMMLVASYSLPLMISFWLVAEKLRASSPMFVTRSFTVKNSPLATSGANASSIWVAPRSTPSTWNSNLPSRTVEPAGAGTSPAGCTAVEVELPETEELESVELEVVCVFLSLPPMLPMTNSAKTTATSTRPTFIPVDMPAFAGGPANGADGPNGAVVLGPRLAVEVTLAARIRWIWKPTRCWLRHEVPPLFSDCSPAIGHSITTASDKARLVAAIVPTARVADARGSNVAIRSTTRYPRGIPFPPGLRPTLGKCAHRATTCPVEPMILRRIPVFAPVDAGDVDEDDVVDFEAEAVLREVRNPDGLLSEQDGAYGYQLSLEAADSSLRTTAEEWQTLGIRPSKMFSLVPIRASARR